MATDTYIYIYIYIYRIIYKYIYICRISIDDDDGRGHGQAIHGIARIHERSHGGMAQIKLFDPFRTAKAKIIIFIHRNNMLGSAVCMQVPLEVASGSELDVELWLMTE